MKKRLWMAALLAALCTLLFAACAGTRYQITVQGVQGGLITLSQTEASAGQTVHIACTPDDGYALKEGSLKANGDPVEEYSFKMPAQDVIITAEFVKIDFTGSYLYVADEGGKSVYDVIRIGAETLTVGVTLADSDYAFHENISYSSENFVLTATVNEEEWTLEVGDGVLTKDGKEYVLTEEVWLDGTYTEIAEQENKFIERDYTFADGRLLCNTYEDGVWEQTEADYRLCGDFLYIEETDEVYKRSYKKCGTLYVSEDFISFTYCEYGKSGSGNRYKEDVLSLYRKNEQTIDLQEGGAYIFEKFVDIDGRLFGEAECYDFLSVTDELLTFSHHGVPYDGTRHYFKVNTPYVRLGNVIKVTYYLDEKNLELVFHIIDENTVFLKDFEKKLRKYSFTEDCVFEGGYGEPYTNEESETYFTKFYRGGEFGSEYYDKETNELVRKETYGGYRIYGNTIVCLQGQDTVYIGRIEEQNPAASEYGCNYKFYFRVVWWNELCGGSAPERIWKTFGGWE